ncbi:glycosyl transferase family protein, partial [Pseudomonas syringae pv. pisi str. 1704B]
AFTWLLFVVGIALATLSKGVLGLAMPGVVIFAWLFFES